MRQMRCWAAVGLMLTLAACVKQPAGEPAAGGQAAAPQPGAPQELRFWHTQTQNEETELKAIVAEFNALHPDQPQIVPTLIGSYTQLFEKIRAAAAEQRAGALPDLAVAYESMIAEYMQAAVVRPLDDLVADPQVGLDAASLADLVPSYLDTNRFPKYGNQLLSFPFTKSNLMLYYNADMLAAVDEQPPATWDDLLRACRKLKAKFNISPFAMYIDASTLDGLILSFGGKLIAADQQSAGFEQPAAAEALGLIHTLFKEGLAYEVPDKGDVPAQFRDGKCAFSLGSSAGRPYMLDMLGQNPKWNLQGLPVKAGTQPVTVMYGGNICIFKSTPERERQAWEFIKFFSSKAVTARWAAKTGYLPVRLSARDEPVLQQFLAAAPQNGSALKAQPTAVPEPNIAGWQAVRDCLIEAFGAMVNQTAEPQAAAKALDECADSALAGGR